MPLRNIDGKARAASHRSVSPSLLCIARNESASNSFLLIVNIDLSASSSSSLVFTLRAVPILRNDTLIHIVFSLTAFALLFILFLFVRFGLQVLVFPQPSNLFPQCYSASRERP